MPGEEHGAYDVMVLGWFFFVCVAFRFLVRVAVISRTSPQSVTELILITSETCPALLLAQLQLPLADVGNAASEQRAAFGPWVCAPESRSK